MSEESQELSSIKVAARTIGVTTKSIDRWLKDGTLTKIEEGRRVYIPTKEVLQMRDRRLKKKKATSTIFKETQNPEPNKTIAIDAKEYKDLLESHGQLRGLLEAHSTRLLEYKGIMEQKDKEITSLKTEIDQVEKQNEEVNSWFKEIIAESKKKENAANELKKNLETFQKELDRLKSRGLLKRIFNK
jgi:chromosome segregation ATPase